MLNRIFHISKTVEVPLMCCYVPHPKLHMCGNVLAFAACPVSYPVLCKGLNLVWIEGSERVTVTVVEAGDSGPSLRSPSATQSQTHKNAVKAEH